MKREFTVGELLAKLWRLPPHAIVWVEGCDCCGSWDGLIEGFIDSAGQQCVKFTRDGGVEEHERMEWSDVWE